jgi:flagellar motility protein MotE (MotC chaperone)
MKPAEAAQIASQLDTRLLVEIVPRMKDRSAAKMLSAMDTQKAVEITRLIAARKKSVGGN